MNSGGFEFESKDCDIGKVQDENGHWSDDVISRVINRLRTEEKSGNYEW